MFGVQSQFELIRFGLKNLSKNKIRAFYRERVDAEFSSTEARLAEVTKAMPEAVKKAMPGLEGLTDMMLNSKREELRQRYKAKDAAVRKELSEDSLKHSELLLMVAHFESFMKLIHESFLRAAPSMVFRSNPKQMKLSDVFQGDQSWWDHEKFLNAIIPKEVNRVDRMCVKDRAEYFKKHFDVSFGDKKEIEFLGQVGRLRNQISHQIYAPPPKTLEDVKEQPLVPDDVPNRARDLLTQIPRKCFKIGAKSYPSYFKEY